MESKPTPIPPNPDFPDNKQAIRMFVEYKVQYERVTQATFEDYTRKLEPLSEWLNSERGIPQLLLCRPEDVLEWRNSHLHYRNATIKMYIAVLKSFFDWAVRIEKLVEDTPVLPMKLDKAGKIAYIPSPQEIFKIRSTQAVRSVTNAAVFEVLLSSGMRASEICQVRCCDVNWSPKVHDNELNRASPFIGGSIDLDPDTGFRTKRKRRRVVMISKLAAKMLLKHMQKNQLPIDGNQPIFPWTRMDVKNAISRINDNFDVKKDARPTTFTPRKVGFLDIDVDSLQGSPQYLDTIRKLQAKEREEREKNPIRELVTRTDAPRVIRLHPHCLRHFFAITQYYRNYFGNRHDILTVREMMGHAALAQTEEYMDIAKVCMTDTEWKRLYLGVGNEYMSLDYMSK